MKPKKTRKDSGNDRRAASPARHAPRFGRSASADRTDRTPDRSGSRLNHASRLWRVFLEDGMPQLDRWLSAAMRRNSGYGKRDRYTYSEILFACLRFGYLALFLDRAAAAGITSRPATLLPAFEDDFSNPDRIVDAWLQMPAERLFHFVGRRYDFGRPQPLWPLQERNPDADSVFRRISESLAPSTDLKLQLLWQGLPVAFALPLEARAAASGWTAGDLTVFLAAQSSRPPLWIRLNRPERAAEVMAECAAENLAVTAEHGTFRLEGRKGVFELQTYKKGLFEIQDQASQAVGGRVEARPGQCVWDCCAGEGGKTLQVAAVMGNRGAIHASDIREWKLKELRARVARAGFDTVRTFAWDGEAPPDLSLEVRKRSGFDWVLVDAPCTATGTWRRNPDARFRVDRGEIDRLVSLQHRLLANAAPAVRPGGRLVYGTCSWFAEENEGVVERFLAEHPDFAMETAGLHGCPQTDADTMWSAVMIRDNGKRQPSGHAKT